MFHYMLMPLDQHYDGGLGATGDAFEEAADKLVECSEGQRLDNAHLPISFLYRHAIELFLKSMIVVLHRSLSIPDGSEPSEGPPFIPRNGKWKPMNREHGLLVLWNHVVELLGNHESELKKRCRTDWQDYPDELGRAIEMIDKADPSSTFFRYTDDRKPDADHEKSSWKEYDIAEIFSKMGPEHEPAKAFLLLGADESIQHAYQYDSAAMVELSKALRDTAKLLSGAHSGLRVELAGGF
jgi:hypothetical protein